MRPDDISSEHERMKHEQKAAARSFGDKSPSQVRDVYWLYAENLNGGYPKPTPRSGKWLLFVPNIELDAVWVRLKKATETGKLGGESKVSTAKPNPNSVDPAKGVVCVYTYDSEDENDVMRVRAELRILGFVGKIPYKTDEATLRGRYKRTGSRGISKYYC